MRTPLARERRTRASRASAYLCVGTQEPSRASWALLGARLPVLYSFAVGQKKSSFWGAGKIAGPSWRRFVSGSAQCGFTPVSPGKFDAMLPLHRRNTSCQSTLEPAAASEPAKI